MKASTPIAMGFLALVALTAPAAAQGPARDPPPEEQRLNEMMTMMRDMRADMQRMREHMAAMQGTGAMPGGMEHQCPALAPATGGDKSGG